MSACDVVLTAGALNLLRNLETIDWPALYSGEICIDEVQRVRRVARRDIIALPTFLADVDKYRAQLRQIALVNGVEPLCAPPPPPARSNASNVERAVAAPRPARRVTAKPTVSSPARLATKRLDAAVPPLFRVVRADAEEVEKIDRGEDRLRLTGTAVQLSSFPLTSTAAMRLVKLHKQCQRSASVDSISRPLGLFSVPTDSVGSVNRH